jgi:hypothetical protein
MPSKMMEIDWLNFNQEYGAERFRQVMERNGFINDEAEILAEIVCEINNQYSYADYHLIFSAPDFDDREYGDSLFRFISLFALRSNLAYLRLFFDTNGRYTSIPIYQRIMRKKQTGNDSTNGSATVNLKNSNSPINAEPEVFNPTSKSSSSSSSNSSVTYNNVTDYDNINETEMRNYYANLETIITWIRRNWFDYLIYEFQVNNA